MKKSDSKTLSWPKRVSLTAASAGAGALVATHYLGPELNMGELAAGLKSGEVALYLSLPATDMPQIDISHMTQDETFLFQFMLAQERQSPRKVAPLPVHVTNSGSKEVCQIYLSAEEIDQLSKIPAPHSSLDDEKASLAQKICKTNRVVSGAAEKIGPFSVVAPEGRVAMKPLAVEPKLISKR